VFAGAERRRDDGLRFAAREQRRAVRARQPADVNRDRADLAEAATIGPVAAFEDVFAEDLLLEVIENRLGHLALFDVLFGVARDDRLLERVHLGVAFELAMLAGVERVAQAVSDAARYVTHHLGVKLRRAPLALGDAELLVLLL